MMPNKDTQDPIFINNFGKIIYGRSVHFGHPSVLLKPLQLKLGEVLLDGGTHHDAQDHEAQDLVVRDERYSALCLEPSKQLIIPNDDPRVSHEIFRELEHFSDSVLGKASAKPESQANPFPIPLTMVLISYEASAPPPPQQHRFITDHVSHFPKLWATQYRGCYVWDQVLKEGWICSLEEEVIDALHQRLEQASIALNQLNKTTHTSMIEPLKPSWSEYEHAQAVKAAQDLMQEGEIYQVNLTCALHTELPAEITPEDLYERLRKKNPAPFGAFIHLDKDRFVLCQSPERFLKWDHQGSVSTEPIKGTRPRVADPIQDQLQRADLRESIKDRAEHTMIVDLERNDLGRVCKPGSIHVSALRTLRSFPTLHHLVSIIGGQLRSDITLADLLTATFPGGSITGAPKRRAMEVIARLENHPRGIYCGALGYLSPDGSADFNLPIRTCWIDGSTLIYHAGGGIVADSTPEDEWSELWVKAQAISQALRNDHSKA